MSKRKTLYELALAVKKWRDKYTLLTHAPRSAHRNRLLCAADAAADRASTVLYRRVLSDTGSSTHGAVVLQATHDAHTAAIKALEDLYKEHDNKRDEICADLHAEGVMDGIEYALGVLKALRGDEG